MLLKQENYLFLRHLKDQKLIFSCFFDNIHGVS